MLVLLEDQDRTLWHAGEIDEGIALAARALAPAAAPAGPYALQAAIAAEHARAGGAAGADWSRITALFERLLAVSPSPVVELNRAVAVALADGPERGLELLDELEAGGRLERYHLLPAARADLLRRLGRSREAARGLPAGDRADREPRGTLVLEMAPGRARGRLRRAG